MIRYVLMAATAVLLVGCTTTGTTVNTDSGESYELRRSGNSFVVDVPSTIQDTHLAILRGFRDLRITPIMHNDAVSALYEAEFADATPFSVRLSQIDRHNVHLRIRVGTLADQPRAEYLFRQFESYFPDERFSLGPDGK
ncbi:MAG TPA: hypothetical protein DCR55_18080 [Lentisphaeria bacterium]|nr:hypothetical protein [Lentisphaeria bacterium]